MHLKVTSTFHFTASFSKIALEDTVQELQVFPHNVSAMLHFLLN